MVAQPLRELQEPWKKGHRLLAVHAKNKMERVGSSRNGCATIGETSNFKTEKVFRTISLGLNYHGLISTNIS
jgi:hypothetical protein